MRRTYEGVWHTLYRDDWGNPDIDHPPVCHALWERDPEASCDMDHAFNTGTLTEDCWPAEYEQPVLARFWASAPDYWGDVEEGIEYEEDET